MQPQNSFNQIEFTKALAELESEIKNGVYKRRRKEPVRESWGSAGVFVTND